MGHRRLVLASAACALLGACKVAATFDCAQNEQCGPGGVCQPTGYCSFVDTTCTSGQRYDDYAGGGYAGQCVDALAPDGPVAIDAFIDGRPQPDATPPIDAFPPLAVRSNIGGNAFTGTDYPGMWTQDGQDVDCPGAPQLQTSLPINGTVDDELFKESRRDNDLRCNVQSLPAGMYSVRMLFAEIVYQCAGGPVEPRVFDVEVEGVSVVNGVSSDVAGGGCATELGHPYEVQTTTTVTGGSLEVRIHSVQGDGVLAALEVIRVQ